MKATPTPIAERLVHVPEHQHERQEVGHRRHAAERHHVEQERERAA